MDERKKYNFTINHHQILLETAQKEKILFRGKYVKFRCKYFFAQDYVLTRLWAWHSTEENSTRSYFSLEISLYFNYFTVYDLTILSMFYSYLSLDCLFTVRFSMLILFC